MKLWILTILGALVMSEGLAAAAEEFTSHPPGELQSGSGRGRKDTKVYAPGMRFPFESGPAFANSQVYGVGGGSGPAGSQSDKRNYSYPWRDNYCESRSYDMPMCPAGVGHQGQDIRAASAEKNKYWCVAVADGTITNIGSYSVYLTAPDGTRYDYLHMGSLQVKVGDKVKRGQRIGKVSNEFGGTPTTIHMHFNIRKNVEGVGTVYVPPYTSLVESYKALLNGNTDPSPKSDAGADASPDDEETPPTDTETAPPPGDEDDDDSAPSNAAAAGNTRYRQPVASAGCAAGGSNASSSLLTLGVVAAAIAASRRRRRPTT